MDLPRSQSYKVKRSEILYQGVDLDTPTGQSALERAFNVLFEEVLKEEVVHKSDRQL